jgi:hypothetical protein
MSKDQLREAMLCLLDMCLRAKPANSPAQARAQYAGLLRAVANVLDDPSASVFVFPGEDDPIRVSDR